MADLLTSSQSQTTTAPQFYTNYLTNLASAGQNAQQGAQYADVNANQQAAFNAVGNNVGNYQPGLATAGTTLGQAAGADITGAANPYLQAGTSTSGLSVANPYLQQGTQGADQLIGNYMNPYTQDVVKQIGALNQQNIQQNLSPGITAGAVGAGQFGSQRGANALAMGIANANTGALSQQAQALQAGYTQALQAAQQQRTNQLTAGQTAGQLQNAGNVNQVNAGQAAASAAAQEAQNKIAAGGAQANLAGQTQQLGLNDVNALATLGEQQRTIAQNKQLFPLQTLGLQAGLMQGASIPMSTTQTAQASPLSTIAGLGSAALGFLTPQGTNTTSALDSLVNAYKNYFPTSAGIDMGSGGGTLSPDENIGT